MSSRSLLGDPFLVIHSWHLASRTILGAQLRPTGLEEGHLCSPDAQALHATALSACHVQILGREGPVQMLMIVGVATSLLCAVVVSFTLQHV